MSEMPPPIDPQLFRLAADGSPILLAGRDRDTGRIAFPPPADNERFETIALPRHGRLWSWTIQRFRPKSPPYAGPEAFEPYAVGYVALGDTIIIEGRLTGAALDGYRIDMPMELVAIAFTMADGSTRTTFAFAPGAGGGQ